VALLTPRPWPRREHRNHKSKGCNMAVRCGWDCLPQPAENFLRAFVCQRSWTVLFCDMFFVRAIRCEQVGQIIGNLLGESGLVFPAWSALRGNDGCGASSYYAHEGRNPAHPKILRPKASTKTLRHSRERALRRIIWA